MKNFDTTLYFITEYEKDDKGIEISVKNKDGVVMIPGKDYIQLQFLKYSYLSPVILYMIL